MTAVIRETANSILVWLENRLDEPKDANRLPERYHGELASKIGELTTTFARETSRKLNPSRKPDIIASNEAKGALALIWNCFGDGESTFAERLRSQYHYLAAAEDPSKPEWLDRPTAYMLRSSPEAIGRIRTALRLLAGPKSQDSPTAAVQPSPRIIRDDQFAEIQEAAIEALDEMLARFDEVKQPSELIRLTDPALETAPLSARLGYGSPPVQFLVLRRPDHHELLDQHPDVQYVHVLRIHDPMELTQVDVTLGAKAPVKYRLPRIKLPPPAPQQLGAIKAKLESWKRCVGRLRKPRRMSMEPIDWNGIRSVEMGLFCLALDAGTDFDDTKPTGEAEAAGYKKLAAFYEQKSHQFLKDYEVVTEFIQPVENVEKKPSGILTRKEAATLFAALTRTKSDVRRAQREMRDGLGQYTEASVCRRAAEVIKSRKRDSDRGGKHTCSSCQQLVKKLLPRGKDKLCRDCFIRVVGLQI